MNLNLCNNLVTNCRIGQRWKYQICDSERSCGEIDTSRTHSQYVTLRQLSLLTRSTDTCCADTSDADALLTTYPTFTTAQQLVRKLFERYNVPPPANNKNLDDYAKNFVKPIQVRVCHILKKFVMWKYATLDRNLINLLKVVSKLMEDRLGVTLKYTMMKESMKLVEQRATPRQSISVKAAAPTTKPAKTGVKLLPVKEKNGLFLHSNSELLAKQLTLLEFETYAVIQAQELIGESWNKKNKDQLSPNIRKMIDR